MVLSCTVSEIRRLIGWKSCIFHTTVLFGALAPYVPLGISRRGSACCGESCMILTSTVFDWSTRVTDRRPDRQNCDSIYALQHYNAVARKNADTSRPMLCMWSFAKFAYSTEWLWYMYNDRVPTWESLPHLYQTWKFGLQATRKRCPGYSYGMERHLAQGRC